MERLASQTPTWTLASRDAPEPVVVAQCAIVRNLTDFVFPPCCIDDERRAIETRILGLISKQDVISGGTYYDVNDMDAVTVRMLAERRLITYEMLCAVGPRGVYISRDQALAVMINASDHLIMRALTATGKVSDAYAAANSVDDALGAVLDFAYHERLGYLTRSLGVVGAGVKLTVLLHLPGLVMTRAVYELEHQLKKRRLQLCGVTLGDPRMAPPPHADLMPGAVYGLTATVEQASCQCLYLDLFGALAAPTNNTAGNLFLLRNQDTLGLSEEELVFHMEEAVSEILVREGAARDVLMRDQGEMLLDSIGRALGIASGARQIGMGEALSLASLIRFADAQGVMTGFDRAGLNKTLLECQSAHLQTMHGIPPDAQMLASERARLFRAFFSGATIN